MSKMEETADNATDSGRQDAAGVNDAGGEGKTKVCSQNCIINNKSMVSFFLLTGAGLIVTAPPREVGWENTSRRGKFAGIWVVKV